jgi:hypothetical protein
MIEPLTLGIEPKSIAYSTLDKVANLYFVKKEEYESKKPTEITYDNIEYDGGYHWTMNRFFIKATNGDMNNDAFWAEETAHFLRRLFVPNSEGDVQEFFGGLARLVFGEEARISMSDEDVIPEEASYQMQRLSIKAEQMSAERIILILELSGDESREVLDLKENCKNLKTTCENALNILPRISNKLAHKIGYGCAQKLYDHGIFEKLLDDHPDLIRLPDENVRELIKTCLGRAMDENSEPDRDYIEVIKGEPCLGNRVHMEIEDRKLKDRVLKEFVTEFEIFKRKEELEICFDCPHRTGWKTDLYCAIKKGEKNG